MKKFYKRVITFLLITLVLSETTLYSLCEELEKTEQIELERIDEIERIDLEETEMLRLTSSSGNSGVSFFDTNIWLAQHWRDAWSTFVSYYVSASDAIVGSYMDFHTWLEQQFTEEEVTEFDETPISVYDSGDVDVPEEVQQIVINYVTYCIQQNPLTYKTAYIKSYNYLSPSQFSNFGLYKSIQEFIKNSDGFVAIHGENRNGVWDPSLNNSVYVIPKTVNYGLYGTVTNGSMSAQLAVNWQTSGKPQNIDNRIKCYTFNGTGQFTSVSTCYRDLGYLKNPNTITSGSTTDFTLFTNTSDSELVYVFSSLNAYKNYNAGLPQNYYMTQAGIDTPLSSWTATHGSLIAGQDLVYYGQTYSTISTQTQTGWTAEEVLALVQQIMTGTGSGSGSCSGSGGGVFDFLGDIGDAVGSLVRGLGEFIAEVIGGIVDAVLDLLNIFVGEDGLLSKLTNLINTGFNSFLSAVFSWLPSEIVTIFTASIVVGIFFAIWKMIRG